MAYGLRLRIEYLDINDVLTRINVYQDGYSSTADIRQAHAGIRVDWGDQGADGMPIVYGSGCTVYFDAEADYEFLYLFATDARKHRVDIEKNSVLFWSGYVEPDSWSEPLVYTPYPVQLTAYDGLGFLKDSAFVDSNGDAYTGKKTMFEILQICLLKTGLSLNINTSIDWLEENQTPGTDLLKAHQVNCDALVSLNCYDVLETLFKECRIFQRAGQWWVISNSQLINNVFYYFRTTPAGVESSGNFNPVASGFWFEGTANMNMLPAVKELTITQDYGYNSNLVTNGSFADFNASANQFDTWTNVNVTPAQRDLNRDGDKFVFIAGKQYPDTFAHEGYGLITNGIKKSFPVKSSTGVCTFQLKYALAGYKYASLMFIRILLKGSGINYYLKRKPFVVKDQEFEWYNLANIVSQGDSHITLGSHLQKQNNGNLYLNKFDPITPYSLVDIVDHFESFKANVTGLPVDGDIEIQLLVPYSDRTDIYGSCYTGVSVELLDQNEEKYPESVTYKIQNSEKNNFVPDEITTLIGDYPSNPTADTIYRGGITRMDGSHTTGWKASGESNYYTFAELIGRMMVSGQRLPRQSYQLRIADIIPSIAFTIDDPNNPGKRFVEHGISYDDRFQAIDGRYTEVLSLDFTDQTVLVKQDYASPQATPKYGGGSTGAFEANPNNKEERVQTMDEKSAVTSKAGYLDDEYFESVIDEETGYNRIRPRFDAGILTGLSSASVSVTFRSEYKSTPVGRKNIHVYRVVEPETGIVLDEDVLHHSVAVTTTGFTLTIDSSESLTGVVIEYLFTPQNKLP